MNFTEKYDQLINEIEEAVKANEEDISEKLSKFYGTNTRHLAEAFQFISGVTLSQYIKQRRLIHAMHFKFDNDCSLETAAIKFGFPDAATMSKAFKSCFGVSPTQMSFAELNAQLPLTLEQISAENSLHSAGLRTADYAPETQEEIQELACAYQLSDSEAAFAYDLSKKRDISLDRAFALVKDFATQDTLPMDNREFRGFLDRLKEYLDKEKVFIENPFRMAEVERVMDILIELFPDQEKGIKDDPLQMGAVILYVEGTGIVARGEDELALFAELCSLVDNFEVYSTDSERVRFAAVMQGAYRRIG